MSNEFSTNITVNLRDGQFNISGTESFVDKYYQDLKEYVKENINSCKNIISPQHNLQPIYNEIQTTSQIQLNTTSSDKYIENGIYYIDENTNQIKILKNVPGGNKATKAKNVAMILLYAKNGEMSNSEIIAECQEQACFDSANFSSVFKKKDGCFIRTGNGKTWTLRLTTPGRKAAEELLESMIDVK